MDDRSYQPSKKGRFNSIITGSYNRTNGHRPNMEFEQYGGYTRLGYELDHSWNVSADLNLTHFNASNPGTVSTPVFDNDSRITRGMTSLLWKTDTNVHRGHSSFSIIGANITLMTDMVREKNR